MSNTIITIWLSDLYNMLISDKSSYGRQLLVAKLIHKVHGHKVVICVGSTHTVEQLDNERNRVFKEAAIFRESMFKQLESIKRFKYLNTAIRSSPITTLPSGTKVKFMGKVCVCLDLHTNDYVNIIPHCIDLAAPTTTTIETGDVTTQAVSDNTDLLNYTYTKYKYVICTMFNREPLGYMRTTDCPVLRPCIVSATTCDVDNPGICIKDISNELSNVDQLRAEVFELVDTFLSQIGL